MRIRIFKKKIRNKYYIQNIKQERDFFIEKSRDVRWSDDIFYWQL